MLESLTALSAVTSPSPPDKGTPALAVQPRWTLCSCMVRQTRSRPSDFAISPCKSPAASPKGVSPTARVAMPPVRGASKIVAARTQQSHQRILDSPYASQAVAQKVARGVSALQKSQDQGKGRKKIKKRKKSRWTRMDVHPYLSFPPGSPSQRLLYPEIH